LLQLFAGAVSLCRWWCGGSR